MKILHALGWYFPDSLGGTEIYVRSLAERQVARGHAIEIAAPKAGGDRTSVSDVDGIPVFRYPVPSIPTREEAQRRVPARGSENFRRYLARLRPDILHVHTFTTGLGLHEIAEARELGIKTIATNHLGSVGFLCQRGTMMRWGARLCDGVVEPLKCAACELHHRGLPQAAAWVAACASRAIGARGTRLPGKIGTTLGMADLIVHNRALQQDVLMLLDRFVLLNRTARDVVVRNGGDPKKLAVNYLGISHRESPRKPSARERPTRTPVTFGYLGRFESIKGVVDLARAVASIPESIPLRLELRGPAGDDGMRRQIETAARDDSRISIEPPVPPEAVPEILAGYDVLCVPSNCFEGGPTVVGEAHAVGTPVIGTPVGVMPEVIKDGVNGALVASGDWRALARVIADVATRPSETIDVWRGALPDARTMDDVAADYETLYAEVTC